MGILTRIYNKHGYIYVNDNILSKTDNIIWFDILYLTPKDIYAYNDFSSYSLIRWYEKKRRSNNKLLSIPSLNSLNWFNIDGEFPYLENIAIADETNTDENHNGDPKSVFFNNCQWVYVGVMKINNDGTYVISDAEKFDDGDWVLFVPYYQLVRRYGVGRELYNYRNDFNDSFYKSSIEHTISSVVDVKKGLLTIHKAEYAELENYNAGDYVDYNVTDKDDLIDILSKNHKTFDVCDRIVYNLDNDMSIDDIKVPRGKYMFIQTNGGMSFTLVSDINNNGEYVVNGGLDELDLILGFRHKTTNKKCIYVIENEIKVNDTISVPCGKYEYKCDENGFYRFINIDDKSEPFKPKRKDAVITTRFIKENEQSLSVYDIDATDLMMILQDKFLEFLRLADNGECAVVVLPINNGTRYVQYHSRNNRTISFINAEPKNMIFCLNDNREYAKKIKKENHSSKQQLKNNLKGKFKTKFIVGRKYMLNISGMKKTFVLKKSIYCVDNRPMCILVVKQIDGQPSIRRCSLTEIDCKGYHIKYEDGLEVLPMSLKWKLLSEKQDKTNKKVLSK